MMNKIVLLTPISILHQIYLGQKVSFITNTFVVLLSLENTLMSQKEWQF